MKDESGKWERFCVMEGQIIELLKVKIAENGEKSDDRLVIDGDCRE